MASGTGQMDATESSTSAIVGEDCNRPVGIVKLGERLISMLLLDHPLTQGPFWTPDQEMVAG